MELIDQANDSWIRWHPLGADGRTLKSTVKRPEDWSQSIENLLLAGLPIWEICRLIPVAMMARVKWSQDEYGVWRYFMGCCRNVLKDIEVTARTLIDNEAAASNGDESR